MDVTILDHVAGQEMKSKKKHKVFTLDDHPIMRCGLMQLINQEEGLEVCGEAGSTDEAFANIETAKPDIVIVDINLQGRSGIEFIKAAKIQYPEMLFLIHSIYDENLYAERALQAGARGYVMKQEASEKMVLAIQRVLGRQIYVSDQILARMLEQRFKVISEGGTASPQAIARGEQTLEALLLVSNPKAFKVLGAALEGVGCQIADNFEGDLDVDLVIIDLFYLKAGMADFVKARRLGIPILLVLFSNETLKFEKQFTDRIDDVIVLEACKRPEDSLFLAVHRLKNALHFRSEKFPSKEFGAGLWASLMPRLDDLD